MEKSAFSLFQAREAAENYVKNIYAKTNMVSAVVHVAVDPSYRCLPVPEVWEGKEAARKLAERQSVCIFRVRYVGGTAVVNDTEYVSDALL